MILLFLYNFELGFFDFCLARHDQQDSHSRDEEEEEEVGTLWERKQHEKKSCRGKVEERVEMVMVVVVRLMMKIQDKVLLGKLV